MLELILAAREDEDFDKTPHNGNVTKGLYDSEIVAHITHFFLAGIMMMWDAFLFLQFQLLLNYHLMKFQYSIYCMLHQV